MGPASRGGALSAWAGAVGCYSAPVYERTAIDRVTNARTACLGALASLALATAGCLGGSMVAPADAAGPAHDGGADDLVVPAPDLARPLPVDNLHCHDVACKPPSCCGAACQDGSQCCPGTICGPTNRCVPASCQSCGEVGCTVDFVLCTAACSKPACCLKACASDGDCCPGARCAANTMGEKRCTPKTCDACDGLTPICQVSAMCDVACAPPPSCGAVCHTDGECGVHSGCHSFLDGAKYCVPDAFQAQCNACGPKGCLFHPDRCEVECAPASPPDLAMSPVDAGAGTDLSASVGDGAAPSEGGLAGPDGGACKACCQPCVSDGDCCAGTSCQSDDTGHPLCVPAQCLRCLYGCSFYCPS